MRHAPAPLLTACLALLAAMLVCPQPAAAQRTAPEASDTVLARDGRAFMPIVVHRNASEQVRKAAEELRIFLSQATGAQFDVIAGTGTRGIVVGTIEQFPNPNLQPHLQIQDTYDGREAFAIRTEPRRVLLIGATDLGTSHAVYSFLHELGFRWFFPSDAWQVIPELPELTVNIEKHDRPVLLSRRIWYGGGIFDRRAREDYEDWSRRNLMAASITVRAGHVYQAVISRNRDLVSRHPEYLALVDGVRRGPDQFRASDLQLCLSNPGAQQMVVDFVLERFRANPDEDMSSVDPSDGADHCECDQCAAMGKVSNRVFNMANIAARAVNEEFPGKMVGLYAYNQHSEPPDFQLEPNVYIQLTAGFIRGQYTFDELIELWPEKTNHMGLYEYFSVFLWDWDKLPGGRAANVRDINRRIQRYVGHGATSLDAESGNNWGVHGRGYYIANQLMWNPERDLDELLADFYEKAFGPAAEPMARYYDRVDPENDPLVSEHLLAMAFRDIEEAWELAADRPDVRDRIEQLIWYLRYIHLRWEFDSSDDDARKGRLARDILTHIHRTRYSYMNHWVMFQNWQSHRWAREFNNSALDARQNAFGEGTPVTRSETISMLNEALQRFEPEEIEQVQFSQDLVPVAFDRSESSATRHTYQHGMRYALYSLVGEPIRISLTAGTIAHFRDRADAHYTFFDAENQSIEEGYVPLDGQPRPLNVRVPGPGLYFMDINSSSAGWRIEADENTIVTIPLQRSRAFSHSGHMQTMYFYVPRGTQTISYYWSGHPHRVHGPDGSIIKEVDVRDQFIHIDVPRGAAGQVWHFTRLRLGHMWFFNVPNYLASSPDALLVPREVAQSDRLPIRGRRSR